jgi:hypothetical protein
MSITAVASSCWGPRRSKRQGCPSNGLRVLLSVVKNVKTPTMVMTGEADYRTPISDSEQYYGGLYQEL